MVFLLFRNDKRGSGQNSIPKWSAVQVVSPVILCFHRWEIEDSAKLNLRFTNTPEIKCHELNRTDSLTWSWFVHCNSLVTTITKMHPTQNQYVRLLVVPKLGLCRSDYYSHFSGLEPQVNPIYLRIGIHFSHKLIQACRLYWKISSHWLEVEAWRLFTALAYSFIARV